MPWRWLLRIRSPDPVASERAEAVSARLDELAHDVKVGLFALEQLSGRLEGLGEHDQRT